MSRFIYETNTGIGLYHMVRVGSIHTSDIPPCVDEEAIKGIVLLANVTSLVYDESVSWYRRCNTSFIFLGWYYKSLNLIMSKHSTLGNFPFGFCKHHRRDSSSQDDLWPFKDCQRQVEPLDRSARPSLLQPITVFCWRGRGVGQEYVEQP